MARSPWPSLVLKTQFFVWTRRVIIFYMCVGLWEMNRLRYRWGLNPESDSWDLRFWGALALMCFVVWYRLRNIEAEIRDQAGARALSPD